MPADAFRAAESSSMSDWEKEQARRAGLTPEERAAEEEADLDFTTEVGAYEKDNDARYSALEYLGIEEDPGHSDSKVRGYASARVNDDGQLNRINGEHPDKLFERLVIAGKDPEQVIQAINSVAGVHNWQPPNSLRAEIDARIKATGSRERARGAVTTAEGRLEELGMFDPEALQREAILLGDLSEYYVDPSIGRLSEADPESVASQQRALEAMEGVYGADPSGSSFAEGQRQEIDQRIRQQREAQLADLQARGMAGGGAEIAGVLGGAQASAQAKAAAEADAQRVAMEAMQSAFDMGGGIRDYRQGISNANAEIDRLAEEYRKKVALEGHVDDTGEKRDVRDANIDTKFDQAGVALDVGQLGSSTEMGIAGAESADRWQSRGQREGEIARSEGKAAEKREATTNVVGGGIETGVGAVRTYYGDPGGVGQMSSGSKKVAKGAQGV